MVTHTHQDPTKQTPHTAVTPAATTHRHEAPVETELRDERRFPFRIRRISWGAIFAGVLIAAAAQLLFSILGLAIGVSTIDPVTETNPVAGLGVGAGIWWLITGTISLFLGGWAAGRMAGFPRSYDGILHGVCTWSAAFLLAFVFVTSTAMRVISATVSVVGDGITLLTEGTTNAAAAAIPNNMEINLREQRVRSAMQSIRSEAYQLLLETKNPELKPEQIRQEARQMARIGRSTAVSIAKHPGQAGTELDQALAKVERIARDTAEEFDKESVANVLASETNLSKQQALATVENWQQQLQQVDFRIQDDLRRMAQRTETQARQVGEEATDAMAAAAFWTFGTMVLGLAAAAGGGWVGSPRHTPEVT